MKGIFLFILYQLINTFINAIIIRQPKKVKLDESNKVSVLMPARNEEKTIEKCLNSLFLQDYKNMEIIVLDDNSSDGTPQILEEMSNERLRVIKGNEEPPKGWTGKNWACHRLYLESKGDILIFIDSDTYFSKNAISTMVSEMQNRNLDFISGIPKEETITFGEKITVPFLNFSILSIFPIFLSFLSRHFYFFTVANGQFMMFKRESYKKINGHQAVKNAVVEDIELAKIARKNGLKVQIFNLSQLVSCRMYTNFRKSFLGLSKSYFPLFGMRLIPSIFVWVWMLIITFAPFYVLLFDNNPQMKIFATLSIMATFLIWFITSVKFRLSREIPFYYPLICLTNSLIGFASIFLAITGKTSWKGRVLERKIRLI